MHAELIATLDTLPVRDLQNLLAVHCGKATSSRNRPYLVRTLRAALTSAQETPALASVPASAPPQAPDDVPPPVTEIAAEPSGEPIAEPAAEPVAESPVDAKPGRSTRSRAPARKERKGATPNSRSKPRAKQVRIAKTVEGTEPAADTPKRTRRVLVPPGTRDPRLPGVGTTLKRAFRGQVYAVKVLKDGFSYAGKRWTSLSAIAKEITGTMWNGLTFFKLQPVERRAPKAA